MLGRVRSRRGIIGIVVILAVVVLVGSYFAGYLPFAIVQGAFGFPTPYTPSTRDTSLTASNRVIGGMYTYQETVQGEALSVTCQVSCQRKGTPPENRPTACVLYEDQAGVFTLVGYTEFLQGTWYLSEVTFNFIDTGLSGLTFPPVLHPNTDYLIAVCADYPNGGDPGSQNKVMLDVHADTVANVYYMNIPDFIYPTSIPATHPMHDNYPGSAQGHILSANVQCNYQYDDEAFSVAIVAQTSGAPDELINFDSSIYGGTPPYSHEWDWENDGITDSTEATPSHAFTTEGIHTVSLTVTDSLSLTATDTHDITISAGTVTYPLTLLATNGIISAQPPGGIYESGTTVTLTPTPNTGYEFTSWSGDLIGNDNPGQIVMDSPKTVTANFNLIQQHTLTVNIVGSGTVDRYPDQTSYSTGDSVQLTATPATGWHFVGWTGAATGSSISTTVVMDSSKTVTATFAENQPDTYSIAISIDGLGAVLKNPDKLEYTLGEIVELSAEIANIDYEFSHWSGDITGSENPVTIAMDSNKEVTAHFTIFVEESKVPSFELILVIIGILGIAIWRKRKR